MTRIRIRISLFGLNYSNTIRIPNYSLTSATYLHLYLHLHLQDHSHNTYLRFHLHSHSYLHSHLHLDLQDIYIPIIMIVMVMQPLQSKQTLQIVQIWQPIFNSHDPCTFGSFFSADKSLCFTGRLEFTNGLSENFYKSTFASS